MTRNLVKVTMLPRISSRIGRWPPLPFDDEPRKVIHLEIVCHYPPDAEFSSSEYQGLKEMLLEYLPKLVALT